MTLRKRPAPDFSVALPNGAKRSLSDFAQAPLLLIFLRHLA